MTDVEVEAAQMHKASAELDIQTNAEPIQGILDDVEVELTMVQPTSNSTDMAAKLVKDTLVDHSTEISVPTIEPSTTNGVISSSGALPTTVGGKWEARLQQLRAFKEANGHCNVPRSSRHSSETNSLGEFVHFQRRQFKYHMAGKINTLTQERIQSLNDIEFEWSRRNSNKSDGIATSVQSRTKRSRSRQVVSTEYVSEPSEKREATPASATANDSNKKLRLKEGVWLEHLEKLKSFKQRYDHCNVPRKWSENAKLGEWVHFQRRQYNLWTRGLKNHMTEERIQCLNNVGFEWARNLTRTHTSVKADEPIVISQVPTSESIVEDHGIQVADCI